MLQPVELAVTAAAMRHASHCDSRVLALLVALPLPAPPVAAEELPPDLGTRPAGRRLARLPRPAAQRPLAGDGPADRLGRPPAADRLAVRAGRELRRPVDQPRPAVSLRPLRRRPPAHLPQQRDGRRAVELRAAGRLHRHARLQQRPAGHAGGRRRSRVRRQPRGRNCTACSVADGERVWSVDTIERVRRREKLLRRRQHAAGVGRPAHRQHRRQPAGEPARRVRGRRPRRGQRHGRRRVRQAHRQGALEGDRRTGQLREPGRSRRSAAGRGASCSPAAGWWRSTRDAAPSISSSPGGRRSSKASTPAARSSSATKCSSPKRTARAAPLRRDVEAATATRWSGKTTTRAAARRRWSCTGTRPCSTTAPLRQQRPARRRRRAAVRRVGDRQGEVARAGARPLVAAVRRRPLRVPQRRRRPAAAAGDARALRECSPTSRPQRRRRASRCSTYPAWAAPVLSHGLLYVRGKRPAGVLGADCRRRATRAINNRSRSAAGS